MWWACGGVFCWFVFVGWLVKVFGCLVVFWNLWIFASGFPDFRGLCNATLGLVCSNLCCCWSVYGVLAVFLVLRVWVAWVCEFLAICVCCVLVLRGVFGAFGDLLVCGSGFGFGECL